MALNEKDDLDHHRICNQSANMSGQLADFLSEHFWKVSAAFFVIMVAISAFADRRRHRRTHMDDVGFMPWTSITVFSVLAALLSIALAIKSQ